PCLPSTASRRPPSSTLCPCTTLFRSRHLGDGAHRHGGHTPEKHRAPAARQSRRPDGGLYFPGRRQRPHPDRDGVQEADHRRKGRDRKSTRLNSSHVKSSYAVFCVKKK